MIGPRPLCKSIPREQDSLRWSDRRAFPPSNPRFNNGICNPRACRGSSFFQTTRATRSILRAAVRFNFRRRAIFPSSRRNRCPVAGRWISSGIIPASPCSATWMWWAFRRRRLRPMAKLLRLPLWPHGAPDGPSNPGEEINTTTVKDPVIAGKPLIRLGNVFTPTLTLYPPPEGKQHWGCGHCLSRRWLSHFSD